MYLVINKWVIAVKVSNFSGQYLRNHRTLDKGVLGYIGIVWPKEHSPEVRSFPSGTLCITRLASKEIFSPSNKIHREVGRAKDLSAPRYWHVSTVTFELLLPDFMFRWPCISIYLCNKNQLDAVFILRLFRHSASNVSGIFVAHHQEVYCIYTTHTNCTVHIQYTFWWWATNMPETFRGWLTK